jgi:3'-phosphoadenosine 5'-phosphosulfate sulfotransferase (PAPS reductase)/FAD synthetase
MERWQLKQRVSLPRSAKKIHTREVIRDYYTRLNGMEYVSFSGGKDSTMLAYMVLQMFPDVPLVFDDTGLEFPEIKEHVYKTFPAFIERRLGFRPTIVTVRPKMAYPQVIDRYGYPVVSKEQSRYIYQVRHTKSEKLRKARLEGVRGTINP